MGRRLHWQPTRTTLPRRMPAPPLLSVKRRTIETWDRDHASQPTSRDRRPRVARPARGKH